MATASYEDKFESIFRAGKTHEAFAADDKLINWRNGWKGQSEYYNFRIRVLFRLYSRRINTSKSLVFQEYLEGICGNLFIYFFVKTAVKEKVRNRLMSLLVTEYMKHCQWHPISQVHQPSPILIPIHKTELWFDVFFGNQTNLSQATRR